MELHLSVIGILLMVLALVHGVFPRYFRWKEELAGLSKINQQLMYVHTFFIALAVFLIGLLSWTSSAELVQTVLGRKVSLGIGIFWFFRLLAQFVGYSKEVWQGKAFETVVHVVFTILWIYLSYVYLSIGIEFR